MKRIFAYIWEIVQVVIISLIIIVPIRYFLVQPFVVKGASMLPNFHDGEYLFINEITYRFDEPKRGDVIVFKYPLDSSQYFIKRIIGLPGEKIKIKNGQIIIFNSLFPEGMKIEESSYLKDNQITHGDMEIKLENDEYFVLGDNRSASFDSRRWGPLSRKNIIGKVWLRLWPFTTAEVIKNPLLK